jgi:hypothetical protein
MNDEEKAKEQLIQELNALRKEVGILNEQLEIERRTVKVMNQREFRIEELKK